MARWQGGLERRQAFLGRLVDIGAELFAISAAVVRARMLAEDGDATAVELADLFCRQARRRANAAFTALWRNEDVRNYTAAQQVLAGRFAWAEAGVLDPSGGGPFLAADRPVGPVGPVGPVAAEPRLPGDAGPAQAVAASG
jgi:hypothetical protein